MAAGLIEAGVQVNEVYRRLYEHAPLEKLRLLARALEKIELRDEGRLAVTYISRDDYRDTGASEALTEGVIDHLRTIDGTSLPPSSATSRAGRAARKVSMRSTDGRVDVSAIARQAGGGGHRRAAGFGTDLPYEQVVDFLLGEIDAQFSTSRMGGGGSTPTGGLLVDKPAGVTSHDVVARVRRERGGKVGHAGTLDPFATGLLIVLLGRATRLQRFLLELPKTYRAVASACGPARGTPTAS